MPMTHVPEVGTENRYRKSVRDFPTVFSRVSCKAVPIFSGTDFWYENGFW